MNSYEDLQVFKKAYKLSLEIHKASLTFPKIEQLALGDQIRRASKSICTNIAEGHAKQIASKADFKRFLSIAIGSSDEMKVWLQYCFDLGYINNEQNTLWKDQYKEISRMLFGLYKNIK